MDSNSYLGIHFPLFTAIRHERWCILLHQNLLPQGLALKLGNAAEPSCCSHVIENSGCGMRYPWAVFSPLLCYAVCKTAEGSVPILSQVCTGLSVKPGVIPSISEIVPLLPLRTFVAAGTEQYNHPSFRLTHFPLGNYPLLAKD